MLKTSRQHFAEKTLLACQNNGLHKIVTILFAFQHWYQILSKSNVNILALSDRENDIHISYITYIHNKLSSVINVSSYLWPT